VLLLKSASPSIAIVVQGMFDDAEVPDDDEEEDEDEEADEADDEDDDAVADEDASELGFSVEDEADCAALLLLDEPLFV